MRSLLEKLLICSVVLTLFIAYIPFENFALQAEAKNVEEKKSEEKEPIELVDLRTENAKTFDNLDGTYTAEIAQEPIHYQDKEGNWREIDNSLVETNNGKTVTNKANDFSVEIDKTTTASQQNITITDDSKKIDFGLVSAQHETANKNEQVQNAKGIVDNNTIRYQNVLKDTDVVYTIGSNQIKEDIIYSEKPQDGFPKKITYKLNVSGLTVEQIDQNIYLKDATTHKSLYMIEAPYMYDSFKPKGYKTVDEITSIPEEAKSYQLTLSYEVIGQDLFVYLEPDATWLQSKERVYPITIDPTIVRLQTSANMDDTTIRSANPTQTGGNDFELGVGTAVGGNTVRSLLKFDLSAVPSSTTILSTDLNLWFTSTNNNSPIDISLHKLTSPWEENQASWTYAKTIPYTEWKTAGGDFSSDKLRTVKGIGVPPASIADAMVNWKVPLDVVQGWVNNPTTNYGFMLKSDNETTQIYKKFASSEQSVLDRYKPKLVIIYKTAARLGLEDYWDYDSHELVNGTNYINLGTHNNILQYKDLSILGRADFGFDFVRTYNSKDYEKSALGYGWSFTGDEKIYKQTESSGTNLLYKDADGTIHTFTFDATSKEYRAPVGNYDTIKEISATKYVLTDLAGYKTEFVVRENNNDTSVEIAYISSQEDRNGNRIYYQYDQYNRLISVGTDLTKDVFKNNITFTYNGTSPLISEMKYDNQTIQYKYTNEYLSGVYIKKSTGSDPVLQTSFTYNKGKFISSVKDANGTSRFYTYNNADLASVSVPSTDDASTSSTTNYSLDRNTLSASITDPEENVTRYNLNNNFMIEKILSPDGTSTDYKYDTNYNITEISKSSVDGIAITKNTYDTKGNLLTTISPEGKKESFTYTNFQNQDTITDTNNRVTNREYDSKGNLIKIMEPTGENKKTITLYSYDPKYGELKTESVCKNDESNCTTTEYNINYLDKNKTTVSTDAHGSKNTVKEDLYGNVISKTDGNGGNSNFSYNLKNELEKVQDAKDSIFTYDYDGNGNLKTITNAKGHTTTFDYTATNLIETEKNAIGNTTRYKYNDLGELTSIQKPNGAIINYVNNEDTSTSQVKVGNDVVWSTKVDGNTKIVSNKNNGTKEYTYDNDGLLISIDSYGGNGNITYTYKGSEALASMSYPSSSASDYSDFVTTSYSTDEAYNTKEVKIGKQILATFSYTSDNLLEKVQLALSGGSLLKTYDNSRLASETLNSTATNTLATYSYSYDANDNIIAINSGTGTQNYIYDALNQLTSETVDSQKKISYEYDEVGNRTSKYVTTNDQTTSSTIYEYNAANQLTGVNGQSYKYDANGNLKSDGTYNYTWNEFDQLTKVATLTGTDIAEYYYDELGRRTSSKDSKGVLFYHYDGESNRVLYEQDDDSYVLRSYLYDDNGNLTGMQYKGKTYYYLTNYRGDVLAMTDSKGKVVATYTYDAWGNVLTESGTMATINPYRYAGYRYDEDIKLYYLMARYYNPDTGVFLSLDPVRGDTMNPLTLNGYSYANNNPVMNVDPDGEFSVRTDWIVRGVDAILKAIPLVASIYGLIKFRKSIGKVYRMLSGKKIRPSVEAGTRKYLTRMGVNIAIAGTIVSLAIGTIFTMLDWTIGKGVAWALKLFFRTEKIKVKRYVYWGPVESTEFINFSKRR